VSQTVNGLMVGSVENARSPATRNSARCGEVLGSGLNFGGYAGSERQL